MEVRKKKDQIFKENEMCAKDENARRLRFLEQKLARLQKEGKELPPEEQRELENLRNGVVK